MFQLSSGNDFGPSRINVLNDRPSTVSIQIFQTHRLDETVLACSPRSSQISDYTVCGSNQTPKDIKIETYDNMAYNLSQAFKVRTQLPFGPKYWSGFHLLSLYMYVCVKQRLRYACIGLTSDRWINLACRHSVHTNL